MGGSLSLDDQLQSLVKETQSKMSDPNILITVESPMIGTLETMMRSGFFPLDFDPYRLTMDYETYKFWHPDAELKNIEEQRYQNNKVWVYGTLDQYKEGAASNAISYYLMHMAPDLLYKKSKRPKMDMMIFRTSENKVIEKELIVGENFMIDGELFSTIPVTRYGLGMSRGMYHDETESQYLGTFYYYEPESLTYLSYKTSRTYFNKTDAIIKLCEEFNDEYDKLVVSLTLQRVKNHMDGKLPKDLMMTPFEYTRALFEGSLSACKKHPQSFSVLKENYMKKAKLASPEKHYSGVKLGMYACEDILDQTLAKIARRNGIQVIVLTDMIGSYQVVSEVLDTRDREESFRSLIYSQ